MAKYVYPAVFTAENDGGYSIEFPDLDGCFTQGNDTAYALDAANDALCLMLYHMEKEKRIFLRPPTSEIYLQKRAALCPLFPVILLSIKNFTITRQ